ncbi:MAG: hypothetical protein WAU20_13605, partial [Dokdonella sp.]
MVPESIAFNESSCASIEGGAETIVLLIRARFLSAALFRWQSLAEDVLVAADNVRRRTDDQRIWPAHDATVLARI